MAQIFDKSRGCLPVTAYVVYVTEDTTVTVGDGACTVTITAAQGQGIVITDASAKLTLSTDSAQVAQLPKSAPLSLGKDSGGSSPVYTLGDDGTYRLAVSATTAEMTRPAGADDWFHVRMPMHLHGNNLQHGAGASIFAQGSLLASMSARGFYVEDSGVRVFELDSDTTGAVYMAIGGATIALGEDGVAPTTVLHSHAVYNIDADAATGFNFSALSLAAPLAGGLTTVRLVVRVTGEGTGPQVWTGVVSAWLGTSAPDAAPVLAAGKIHHVVLESDGERVTGHLAYDRDLA